MKAYEKANYLSREAESALLDANRNDPSVTGRRDTALFSLLLRTGCRAKEARHLRWGQVYLQQNSAFVKPGDGEGSQIDLPPEVWQAMRDYLEAAGRLESIQMDEHVFAPSREPLVKEAGGEAEDWAAERALSMDQLHYLVKLYGGWAGLETEQITCHTLRNTAAMRCIEAGMDAAEVQKCLRRKSRIKTEEYILRLKSKPGLQLLRNIKTEERFVTPSRGPGRAEPGNYRAIRHGLTAKNLPELEWLEEQGIQLRGLDREVMKLRVVVRRAYILSEGEDRLKEGIYLLEAAGTAVMRLGKIQKLRFELREAAKRAAYEQALDEAREEVLKEWKL